MKDRLQHLMSHYGYTAARLADEIGVQRSGISHIMSGRNQPSYDFILKIINTFPEISVEWLLTGRGTMQKAQIHETKEDKKPETTGPHKLIQSDLFSNSGSSSTIVPANSKKEEKVTNVTSIDRIVVFYNDGTFSHYIPVGQD